MKPKITVQTIVHAPIEKIWKYWNEPEHIAKWNAASEDWHSPRSENNLSVGGQFNTRMESKDGSEGFDFYGTYTDIVDHEKIAYTMGDGRTVEIAFTPAEGGYQIVETFEAESQNPLEMQQSGWQSILENFKKYVEQA